MNKKFANYFTERGYEIVGSNAYGKINGFEVSFHLEMLNNVAPLQAHFNLFATRDEKIAILNSLKEKRIKYLKYDATSFGIVIGLNDITVNALLKKLDDILNDITSVFAENNAQGTGVCPVCGQIIDLGEGKTVNSDFARVTMHNECLKDINAIIDEENKDFEEAPNNYIKGFLGVLIGAIVGVIATVILYFIGFISALTAVVSIFLGLFLYKKFGGKPNKVMIIMAFATTLITQLATIFFLYVLAATGFAYQDGLAYTGIEAFKYYFNIDPEFKSAFISNFIMSFVFTALGLIAQVSYAKKMIQRTKNLK